MKPLPLVVLLCLCTCMPRNDCHAFVDEAKNPPAEETPQSAAERISSIIDVVLTQHIDPPTRQEMVLRALRVLYESVEQPLPVGLSRRISDAVDAEALLQILDTSWKQAFESGERLGHDAEELEALVVAGLVQSLPGEVSLIERQEHVVQGQLADNRYVGIGIALSKNQQLDRPVMAKVIEGGPAAAAGARDGDIIDIIDGADTAGKNIKEIVTMLRGSAGSEVTVTLRNPKRTYTITRGVVPFKSVSDYRLLEGDSEILVAYLKIDRLNAGTVSELRGLEEQLRQHQAAGLVIDLRMLGGTDEHHGVLLADALLAGGPIGQVRTQSGERTHQATGDCLFRDLPLAVLVNRFTRGIPEWVVAALQDNQRAIVVGNATAGAGYAMQGFDVPGTDLVINLPMGQLVRANGKQLGGRPTHRGRPRVARIERRGTAQASVQRPNQRAATGGVIPDHLQPQADNLNLPAVLDQAANLLRAKLSPPEQP